MSDYFGALMRSSGLTIGAATTDSAPPASTADLLETDIERSAPALQPPPTLTTQPQARPLPPVATSAKPRSGREAEAPAARPTPPGQDTMADVDRRHDKSGYKDVLPTAVQAPLAAASPTDYNTAAAQPPGHDVVRAVMQWVAADPQLATSRPPRETPHAPLAALDGAELPAMREPTSTLGSVPQARWPAQAPQHSVAQAVEAEQGPPRSATAVPLKTAFAPTPAPSDERGEISIGAIHLRVDAPPAQPLALARPAPAAAPRAGAPASTPRCALARRALRRI
ncbi:hypothetical protein IF690_15155 [Pseudomonas sp. SK3(2021)]|uniref:hypothetical protein n=1 Tax=Pseudomonas sp. SK3(2021) TaxID=2841064 RepID=UPI00192B6C82|nr:hypothetical protein [Pseudomonas sp. SK3(2021)]QQZ39407.1 hypothetical protein IF690_15155 [Pseudomonas sp. SK3(2021)]